MPEAEQVKDMAIKTDDYGSPVVVQVFFWPRTVHHNAAHTQTQHRAIQPVNFF